MGLVYSLSAVWWGMRLLDGEDTPEGRLAWEEKW